MRERSTPRAGDPRAATTPESHGSKRPLPIWAHAADAAVLALLALALYVALVGGFVAHPAGLRVSIRSEWRVLTWALGLLLFRHLLRPRPALHSRIVTGIGEASRTQGPLQQDDVLLRRARQDGGATTRRLRVLRAAGLVLLLFTALTLAMTWPQVKSLDRGVSPDIADPLLSTWRLSWFAHQLPRDPRHLFDANIFYPERDTLAFSDAMLVPSLTVAPLVWMGVHQLLAYNLLLLSGFALSGAAMFLLVRSLTHDTAAAVVAGFAFAFLPYRYMHYAHLELQMSQWMPLCLWSLHATVAEGRIRHGLLTGLFLALQTLSSWYYGIFFATYLVVIAAALLIAAGRARFVRAIRPLVAGAVLAALIVAPFSRPYFAARRSVGERPASEIEFYSATPQNYLAAHQRNVVFGPLTAGLGGQERELFQGITVPLLALAGLWPPLSAARIGYGLGLALAFEISLGFNGLLYPGLREIALPYRGLRVPARMAMVVGLSLAILAGYGVARIARWCRSRGVRIAVLLVLAGLVVVEYRSRLILKDVWTRPPPVYASLAGRPDAVLLELPLIAPDVALEPIYMYFSTFHWHRLVNGYSGFSPPSYRDLLQTMTTFPDDASMAELRRRGVNFVVVHGAFYKPAEYSDLVSRLEQRRDLVFEGVFRWELRDTRLYRVVSGPPGSDPRPSGSR